MPTVIGTQLNDVLVANWTAAELNGSPKPFLAIVLEADQSRSAHLTGVAFGVNYNSADVGRFGPIVQIARNFSPNADQTIFDQIDDGVSGVSPSKLIRPYFRARAVEPFDIEENWPEPKILDAGIVYTVALGIGQNAALANGLDVYLLVSGRWGSAQQRGPKLRQIG